MSRLEQLYQDVILDHNKNPRNFSALENPTHACHGKNPLCGDDYWVELKISPEQTIEDIRFHGDGCAISKASGSLMTWSLIGKSTSEALSTKDLFLELITQDELAEDTKTKLGRLAVFEGVKKFPVRVKCAALVWRALEGALSPKSEQTISTEN